MNSVFCSFQQPGRETAPCTWDTEDSGEYIIEHIINRWTEHISFDGMLQLECDMEHIHSSCRIQKIDVKNVSIRYVKNRKTLRFNQVMHFEVCCWFSENGKRCIQTPGSFYIDMCSLNALRFCENARQAKNVRVKATITPIYSYAAYGCSIRAQLNINLEFIVSREGKICGRINHRNPCCNLRIYPQPMRT